MVTLPQLVEHIAHRLQVDTFTDAALNGLQVQGREEVRLLVGVSASLALFEEAKRDGSDAVLVHHGLFWDRPRPIAGPMAKRLRLLLEQDISLLAYHLPLDAHFEDGNNARIASLLGLRGVVPWGKYRGREIGCAGSVAQDVGAQGIVDRINEICATTSLVLGDVKGPVERVAICSGGGGSLLEQAIDDGADVFITGEPGEPAQELAREAGIVVIGAGHYNTERFGVRALAQHLEGTFEIETRFFEVPNPI